MVFDDLITVVLDIDLLSWTYKSVVAGLCAVRSLLAFLAEEALVAVLAEEVLLCVPPGLTYTAVVAGGFTVSEKVLLTLLTTWLYVGNASISPQLR